MHKLSLGEFADFFTCDSFRQRFGFWCFVMPCVACIDDECRPNMRRCGKSAQCVSVMAFCDGVDDCKNHYDENPQRCCERLFSVCTHACCVFAFIVSCGSRRISPTRTLSHLRYLWILRNHVIPMFLGGWFLICSYAI